MDIVIHNNIISQIRVVGYPGVEINDKRRPQLAEGGHEIEAEDMYVLPGFVDMHGHIGGVSQGADAEYVFKLWMAHGVTTVREVGSDHQLDFIVDHKKRSAKNEITAPRIIAYTFFGIKDPRKGLDHEISTPEEAREWIRWNAENGADGVKFLGAPPELMEAGLDENKN